METTITWHPPATLDMVDGWFYSGDQAVMTWLLDRQDRLEPPGDLLELGCYMGKSAIVIGTHLRTGETFTVCDLFGSAPEEGADERNKSENKTSYSRLTRQAFERNYLTFHEELPVIVQATTDQIIRYVEPGSCRFVHIDASHLWQHVKGDIEAAQTLLRPDGLVVCDDFRSVHTPGVAAAVWTAVANGQLRPICITGNKFYGTWGDPKPLQDELFEWLKGFHPNLPDRQDVLGHPLIRVCRWTTPPLPTVLPLHPVAQPEAPVAQPEAPVAQPEAPVAQPEVPVAPPEAPVAPPHRPDKGRPTRWSARSIARDLLPPVVTRALRRARKR